MKTADHFFREYLSIRAVKGQIMVLGLNGGGD